MKRSSWAWVLIAMFLSGCLAACGGGGGGGGDGPAFRVVDLDPAAVEIGTLTDSDQKAPDGTSFDLYRVSLPQDGTLTVRLESTDFDAYLFLLQGAALSEPDLDLWDQFFLAEDDDSGGGLDAEITLDLTAGTYVIAVNSLDAAVGTYTLRTWFGPGGALQLGQVYLQYRTYEGDAGNRYQGWIQLTRGGSPVEATDVADIRLFDPLGAPLEATSGDFKPSEIFLMDCSSIPCTTSGPLFDSGFWATFPSLAAGIYDLEVDTATGQTLTAQMDYPGQLMLPVVQGSTMQAQWVGGDLTLSWEDPTAAANWSEVSRIQVALFDGAGAEVLYVRLPSTDAEVTVPGALISQAAALGDGLLTQWQVQTRAYDANNMNYARGYSARVALP